MMRWSLCMLITSGLCCVAVSEAQEPATVATYHVSPAGDDLHDGSAQRPWKTIQNAARQVRPGDTVVIHEGAYRERVRLTVSGTAEAPIRFVAAPGAKPVISGAEPVTGPWESLGGGVFRAALPANLERSGWLFVDGPPAEFVDSLVLPQPNTFTVDRFGPAWDQPPVAPDSRPDAGETAAADIKWQLVDAQDGTLNLDALFEGKQRNAVVFAATYVYSPMDHPGAFRWSSKETDFEARYWGTDRADSVPHRMRVWVNGELVTAWDANRGRKLGLKKGWNTVLVMLAAGERAPWKFKLSMTASQYGQPSKVPLKCQASRPAQMDAEPAAGAASHFVPAGEKMPPAINQWLVAGPFPSPGDGQVYVRLAEGDLPDRHAMEWATRDSVVEMNQGGGHVHWSGLTFAHAANRQQDAMVALDVPFCVIDACEVRDSLGRGLMVKDDGIIRNSRMLRNGCTGIGIGGPAPHGVQRLQILDNELAGNNWMRFSAGGEAGGTKLCRLRDSVVRGNRVSENLAWGIWLDWECYGNRIEANVVTNNAAAGIFLEASRGRNVIANNICIGNGTGDGNWGDGIFLQDASDALIAHNLCIDNKHYGIRAVRNTDRRLSDGPVTNSSNTILNNICINNSAGSIARAPDRGVHQKGNHSDHNVLIPGGTAGASSTESLTPELRDLRKLGWDQHSIAVAPTFIDPRQRDYRPAPGSSAIGLCATHQEVLADFNGHVRHSDQTAAGPFESQEP